MTEENDDGSISSSDSSTSSGTNGLVASFSGSNVGLGCNTHAVQHLVRVQAQVMMRDDNRGGWLPRGGGGISNVSVLRRIMHHHHNRSGHSSRPHSHHHKQSNATQSAPASRMAHHHTSHHRNVGEGMIVDFLIYGISGTDKSVVINCIINKDFQYNKVMPTFHHWRSGDNKLGLTFQTAADARSFDRGVRQAVDELTDGLGPDSCVNSQSNLNSQQPSNPPSSLPSLLPSQCITSQPYHCSPAVEEDVFVSVNLPMPTQMNNSSSNLDNDSRGMQGQKQSWLSKYSFIDRGVGESSRSLPKQNEGEYHLHSAGDVRNKDQRRDSISSLKRANKQQELEQINSSKASGGILQFTKRSSSNSSGGSNSLTNPKLGKRSGNNDSSSRFFSGDKNPQFSNLQDRPGLKLICRYCDKVYFPGRNPKGSCKYAPDKVRSCMDLVTCMCVPKAVLSTCCGLDDRELTDPCMCSGCDSDDNEPTARDITGHRGSSAVDHNESGHEDSCGTRCIVISFFALFLPGLLCYPPLRGCYSAFKACELCGGRHEAYDRSNYGDRSYQYSMKHYKLDEKLRGSSHRGYFHGRGS